MIILINHFEGLFMRGVLIICLITIGFYHSNIFAQGTSCTNAMSIPLDGTCNNYSVSPVSAAGWLQCNLGGGPGRITYFSFTTNSSADCVSLDIATSVAGTALEAFLFSGCSGGTATGAQPYQCVCMEEGEGIWASNLWYSNLLPGTTYYLRVKTEAGFTGTIQICGKYDEPSNNLCSGATGIDELATPDQNNACNVGSNEIPPANLCAGSLENTAWYTFTVATSGVSSIIISNLNCVNANFAGNNDYGFQIGFFTGNCGSLSPTNCIEETGASGGTVIASSTSLPAGTVVHVAIDGFAGSNCEYSINAINAAPLAVKLKSFEGWRGSGFNLLTWVTSSEIKHGYFVIERSENGISYSALGNVNGAGTSIVENRYSFKDENPLKSGYYRLKQVDIYGNYTYSRIIRILRPVQSLLNVVFQNPVFDLLKASLETSVPGQAQIQIVDITGKIIVNEVIKMQSGITPYQTNIDRLSSGTYFLVLTKENNRKTFPFIKF
jgi:hypothetical protein